MANNLDFLDLIAEYLEEESIGTRGTDIFVNKQPQSPNDCVCIFGLVGNTMSSQRDVAGLQFPRFQVIVRAADYNDAADTFQAVRTALHGKIGLILPTTADVSEDPYIRVLRCHADQEGGPIGEDDQGRVEFSINMAAEYHHVSP